MSQDTPTGKKSGLVESVQAKAQEVIHEDYEKTRILLADAAKSGAYLYPIRGIIYFAAHRSLWTPLLQLLVPYLILSVSVLGVLFFVGYLPQLAVLAFVNGPLAVFTTVLLVLSEAQAVTNATARTWLLQDGLLDTFDATMLARGRSGIVAAGREVRAGRTDPVQRLGRVLKTPFKRFTPTALVRNLIYLPLNFIPVFGTAAFVYMQSKARGRSVHDRYFQLKQWSAYQRKHWLEEHPGPYTAFGLVATLLEMVPVASVLFSFTNTVGAALWAADLEAAAATAAPESTATNLRDVAGRSMEADEAAEDRKGM